jgi:hypothetical protein
MRTFTLVALLAFAAIATSAAQGIFYLYLDAL